MIMDCVNQLFTGLLIFGDLWQSMKNPFNAMAAYQVSTVMSFIGDGWCMLVVSAMLDWVITSLMKHFK